MIPDLFKKRAGSTKRKLTMTFRDMARSDVSYQVGDDLVTLSFTVDRRHTITRSQPFSKTVLDDLEAWALEYIDE